MEKTDIAISTSPASFSTRFRDRGLHWLAAHQNLQAALVLLAFILVFLSTPLTRFSNSTYYPVDFTQNLTLYNIEPGWLPANALLFDQILQYQPWHTLVQASLSQGKLPLWNPYNGNGVPLLGNYQSEIFSVFNLPFYLFGLKLAVLISNVLKLFGMGWFTYLYLKKLGLRQLPALTGALAYTFSGYNIVWLTAPNASVMVMAPAAIYFAESIFKRFEAYLRQPEMGKPTYLGALVGLTASVLVGLLAGNPEAIYYNLLLVVAYILFRLGLLWRIGHYDRKTLKQVGLLAGQLMLSGLWAFGLAAIQLIPFAEYAANSSILVHRTNTASSTAFDPGLWSFSFFPNLLGNPVDHLAGVSASFNATNYNETNGAYIGSLVLLLALLALLLYWRDRYLRFFSIVSLIWLVYVYGLFNIQLVIQKLIPFLAVVNADRSVVFWIFSVSTVVAIFLNHLLEVDYSPRLVKRNILLTALVGIGLLVVMLVGANQLAVTASDTVQPVAQALAGYATNHIWWIGISYLLGLLTILGLWWAKSARLKLALGSGLLLLVFAQSGYLLKDYNPTVEDRFNLPATSATQQLQTLVGHNMLAVQKVFSLFHNVNVELNIPTPDSYDAIGMNYSDELYKDLFTPDPDSVARAMSDFTDKGLQLFGASYLLSQNDHLQNQHPDLAPIMHYKDITLYRYKAALSQYYTVDRAVQVSDHPTALSTVLSQDFNPAQTVVLEQTPQQAPEQASASISDTVTTNLTRNSAGTGTVTVLSEEPERVTLQVSRTSPGYLVLAKNFYPGWKARINGQAQPVLRADYAFSALPLASGASSVEFYYEPASVTYGLWISIMAWLAGLVLLVVLLVRKRQTKPITGLPQA